MDVLRQRLILGPRRRLDRPLNQPFQPFQPYRPVPTHGPLVSRDTSRPHRPAALLYIGTATVISSVTRVADAAAVGMMTAYHRLLAAGAGPAKALAKASLTEEFSPFVCFGDGSP